MDAADVWAHVMPTITGTREANYSSVRNMAFGNLAPLTDGTIMAPRPDIYYGTISEQLDATVRNELGHYIVPSTALDRLIAPNFFLESAGPEEPLAPTMQQARYDGAVGARAMHSLQNCGKSEPVYDGKAYTYSSTYYAALCTPHNRGSGRTA